MQLSPHPSHKTCQQCATRRPAGDFLPSPLTDDGLTDRCKPCVFSNSARDRADREARRAKATERTPAHV